MTASFSKLSSSEFTEKYVGVLQPLEFHIVNFYRKNPSLYDYDILRVYEALLKYMKAKLTNFSLPQHKLEGISCDIYECLFTFIEEMEKHYSLEELQACLKRLEKSINFWGKRAGSRGYLNHIVQFLR